MEIKHVEGTDRGEIMLYALSTCVWCKKTKRLLSQLGISYSYVDVDLLEDEDRRQVEAEMKRWNPAFSFPTVVIDNNRCIIGYREDELNRIAEK